MAEQQNDKYLIPKDLRSQIKFGAFTIMDISVLVAVMLLWYIIISNMELGLLINSLLFIFHIGIGLFIVMRTSDNPDRPRISVMYSALMHQDDVNYKSIDYNTYVIRKEEEKNNG